MVLQSFVEPCPLFSFFIVYRVGRTPWMGDQPFAKPLPTHTGLHKYRINAHRHPCLKWDQNPRSKIFERAKTVHALHRPATVIGYKSIRTLSYHQVLKS
jgi:hypothetical protein